MAFIDIIDYVWNNLLEEAGPADQKIDWLRQMPCGCIVVRDNEYLDLYTWSGSDKGCTEQDNHDLIALLYEVAATAAGGGEMEGEAHKEFMTLVRQYTNGWGEQDEILTALAAL